jgi:hypothetical protein
VIDGINMGNIEKPKKGLSEEIFKEQKVENKTVCGEGAADRTAISNPKMRKILNDLIEVKFEWTAVKKAILKMKKIKKHNEISSKLINLLELSSKTSGEVPRQYWYLLEELSKETPISQLFSSYDLVDYNIFEAYFKDFMLASRMKSAFPTIMKIMRTIVQEDQFFLPEEIKELLSATVNLRFKFNALARRNAVPRIKPNSDFTEPIAEVYPNNPVHTMENVYRADKEKDSNEDGGCNKDYNECPTITGGLTHITCITLQKVLQLCTEVSHPFLC